MDRKTFLGWVSCVDDLTDAQRADTLAILIGRAREAAVAIELGVGADRQCPHCRTFGGRIAGWPVGCDGIGAKPAAKVSMR